MARKARPRRLLRAALFLLLPGFSYLPAAASERINLFAAASTIDIMREAVLVFKQQSPTVHIRINHAASSTLARQIEAGAPAHLFLSANIVWIDYLKKRNLLAANGTRDLLTNSLVLAAHRELALKMDLSGESSLAKYLQHLPRGRLVIGNPAHVPAGIYGRQALQNLSLWQHLKDKLALAASARNALQLILNNRTLGVVYRTDVLSEPQAAIIAVFPKISHAPIRYPLAITKKGDTAATRRFAIFLHSATARAIYNKHGFQLPPDAP